MRSQAQLTNGSLTLVIRWSIVLALTVLLISMATGQSGISNYMKLVETRDELVQVTSELSMQNQILQQQISDLKNSKDAQIRYLKDNFGYVEKGEFIYRFDSADVRKIQGKSTKDEKTAQAEAAGTRRGG